MKPRTTRVAWIAAASAAAVLGLSACSDGTGGGTASGDATTLVVQDYYGDEPQKTVIGDLLDGCAADMGVTIQRNVVAAPSLVQKTLQQASAHDLPDVLMVNNPDVQQFAQAGYLRPLEDFDIDTSGYPDGILKAGSYDGTLYGLAPGVNTLALFYNEDLLKAAGVTPPTTWDELKAASAALSGDGKYGVAFSAVATYEGSWQFMPFLWSNGGTESDIDTPEAIGALQLWTDLVQSGSASQSVVNWSQADVADQFKAGKAAMMVNGPWQIPGLEATDGLNYGIVQIPVPAAGDTLIDPLGGEMWTVPNTGDDAKEKKAAELVACLNSDKSQLQNALAQNYVPARSSLGTQVVAQVPQMQTFVDLVANARGLTAELGPDYPGSATRIYTAIQSALTGSLPPAEAAAQAQAMK